ncbi:MAG: alpha/beta fold hydrolase [Lewinellaceae bacterium]|nr:alpha/beta fold hydrolase [Saprospiraceae bacterium]MCB9344738.1 alpha/beta fold hydrolase [Lewinellaceae bacterium]
MRVLLLALIAILNTVALIAQQDISGQWNGLLKAPGAQLRVIFNVTKTDDGYTSTMDSPDQGAKGIPVTNTTFENSTVTFEASNLKMGYTGELKDNEIVGTFKQAGHEFPLNLSREVIEKETIRRPQEPTKPYPYYTEDVIFLNTKADIALAGTLTLPKKEGVFPVVVLITGSGPQNRDEELLGHKPFLVIADYLTRNGIAVLRYDDRGVGKSTGDFKAANSADFATDVESAIAYLKTRNEINQKQIGLMGHSEGGLIAPLVAARSKDVGFIVLLAGPGIRGDKILLAQMELIAKASGESEEEIKKSLDTNRKVFKLVHKSKNDEQLKSDISKILNEAIDEEAEADIPGGMSKEAFISMQAKQIASPWMQYFLTYDPAPALQKVKCPVLALNGEKDLQVPSKENLAAIAKALKKGGNKNVSTKEFPGLNHLFQETKTGAPSEYAEIEQTFSPVVLEEILTWIQAQTK